MSHLINCGVIAGKVLELLVKKNPKEFRGPRFVEASMNILTLCLSELIKAGYCPEHFDTAIEKAVSQIKEDLKE